MKINITNNGNREAENVRIELPIKGVYEIARVGESVKVDEFANVVPVGNIGPSSTASVIVWTTYFNEYRENQVRITHSLGTAGVEFAIGINGKTALALRYPTIAVLILLLADFIVYHVGFAIGFWSKGKKVQIPFIQVEMPESAAPQTTPHASPVQNASATNSTDEEQPRGGKDSASPS